MSPHHHRPPPSTGRVQLALNVSDLEAERRVLLRDVRRGAAQAPPGLRQLRHRRAAAQAGAHRDERGAAGHRHGRALNHLGVEVASTDDVVAAAGPASPRPASRPSTRTTRPAATPSRTRCGSTTPPVPPGRSTPSRTTTPATPVRLPLPRGPAVRPQRRGPPPPRPPGAGGGVRRGPPGRGGGRRTPGLPPLPPGFGGAVALLPPLVGGGVLGTPPTAAGPLKLLITPLTTVALLVLLITPLGPVGPAPTPPPLCVAGAVVGSLGPTCRRVPLRRYRLGTGRDRPGEPDVRARLRPVRDRAHRRRPVAGGGARDCRPGSWSSAS